MEALEEAVNHFERQARKALQLKGEPRESRGRWECGEVNSASKPRSKSSEDLGQLRLDLQWHRVLAPTTKHQCQRHGVPSSSLGVCAETAREVVHELARNEYPLAAG